MNQAENLRLLLDGGEPEWMPFSLDVGAFPGFTKPIARRFQVETGATDPAEYFGSDWRRFSLRTTFGADDPRVLHGDIERDTTFDEWGIGHQAGEVDGALDRMLSPLAGATTIREVEALPLPRIDATPDLAIPAGFHRRGLPVFGYAGSIYEWSWWLRGMEAFLVDLATEPAMAEAVIAKVAAHTLRLAEASARSGVDVLCFYDDVGMQTGMQIGPATWRRFIKPAWARILEHLRQTVPAARFLLHSCGDIHEIIEDIVEVGFHVLHPVQPECMDFAAVRARIGRRIALCATPSAQRTLPFGTPEDVRAEVRRLRRLCPDRRAILCPSNLIQPETPWDNILAFAEAARQERPDV